MFNGDAVTNLNEEYFKPIIPYTYIKLSRESCIMNQFNNQHLNLLALLDVHLFIYNLGLITRT